MRHSPTISNIHQSKNFIHDKAFYESPFWKRLSKQCKQVAGYKCKICGKRAKNKFDRRRFHADHIIPRSRGGEDALHNLRCLCEDCHGDLHPHLARAIEKREDRKKEKNKTCRIPTVRAPESLRPTKLNVKPQPGAPRQRSVRSSVKSRLY